MSGAEVGLKAEGLCLEPLLQHGIPSSKVISSIIAEIDDTLTHNNRQLEECVRELMAMSCELTGDTSASTPMEALERLMEAKILDKATCYDPNPVNVSHILEEVSQQLDSVPQCEMSVLQRLLELSSIHGLSLPAPVPVGRGGTDQSLASVNTVPDQQELQNVQIWSDICRKLRTSFLDRLSKLPVGQPGPPIDIHYGKRMQLVQCLCVLHPVTEVWSKYYGLRSQQLETLFPQAPPPLAPMNATPAAKGNKERPPEDTTQGALCPLVVQLETIASSMVTMIQEDFELLVSGVFREATTMFRAIQELYLDRLSEELCSVAIALQVALPTIAALPKSTSESFRLTYPQRAPLSKQLSRSLDNLAASKVAAIPATVEQKPELKEPKTQLEALVRLVNCVLGIDTYIETLHAATTWEVTGPKRALPKTTLKSVLKPTSPEPATHAPPLHDRRESKPFSPRSFEMSGLLPEAIPPPFGTTEAMAASGGGRKVLDPQQEDRPHWDWQRPFRKQISDIAKVVETHLRACTEHCQKVLNACLSDKKTIDTMVLPSGLVGGRLDYAKKVSQAVWELVSEMEWLLPLAAAGSRGPFEVVRAAFVDSVTLSLKDISVTLSRVSTDVSEKTLAMPCLYTTLSTAACVRNHLLHFDNVLGAEEVNKKRFSSPYRHYCDLVDSLARQVIEYHTQLLVSSLLNDSESHDWSSNKEFYEDERCSFGVPMWHLHMAGLQHDLWTNCPPKLAQSILTAVLHDTLMAFVQRYSKAKPSYKRTRQFRRDITLILLVTSEMLYPVTGSLMKYLDVSLAHQASYSIHTLASCLLSTLAVVTSPIDVLYKVFKKGFHRKRSKGEPDPKKGYSSHWLSWIRPALFPYSIRSYDSMQTTAALYVQVKLLMSQPEINWPMLLQSLLMKDYTLAIMLLTRTSQRLTSHTSDEDTHAALMAAGLEIFTAFVDVLTKCCDFPAALSKVLCPVLDRTNSWGLFDAKAIIGKTHPIPPWIEAIFSTLNSFVIRIIDPAVRVILEHESSSQTVEPLTSTLQELPCGCDFSKADPDEDKSTDTLGEAMYSLVTQLVEDVYTLPAPLCMLFRALQDNVDEHDEVTASHDCVGLKLVASSIRIILSDMSRMEKLLGQSLSEAAQDSLKMLAECTYHVLTAISYGKGSGTPRIAGQFMKANRNWLIEQVEIITDHFSNDIFLLPEDPPFKDDPQEFVENQLITTASFILHTETGPRSLEKVYCFTLNNVNWILTQLDIPPLIGGGQSPEAPPDFMLNVSTREPKPFNPLHAFDHIGGMKINQEQLADWPYPWTALLQSDLGLTEVTFSRLLYQRHEMQEGAYLEEREMRPVQGLRAKFEMEPVDLA